MSETERDIKTGGKRTQFTESSRRDRVEKLRTRTGLRLPTYGMAGIEASSLSGNIENYLGTIQIPVGLAGPLLVHFENSSEEILAPMATNEGALVSSIARGALALSRCGGVTARVLSSKMLRVPLFEFKTMTEAIRFSEWLLPLESFLKDLVKNRSSHAKLLQIEPMVFGSVVHVRFSYSTGDASGQNMTTFCTSFLVNWLLQKWESEGHDVPFVAIEGNLSSDKKASVVNVIEGRGRRVSVEAVVDAPTLRRILKVTDVDAFIRHFQQSKSARIYSGMIGFNINVANVVSALFLATGQDFASVHECSVGELHLEKRGDGVYISLLMPNLIVGTVGGGCNLPSARDNLSMLGCQGAGSADRLAAIIASFALALEISTMSAVEGSQFVTAHQKHGRSLPPFKFSDLSLDFFNKSLLKDKDEKVIRAEKIHSDNKQGYASDLALQMTRKLTGLMAFHLESENSESQIIERKAFLKIKPRDQDIVSGAARVLEVVNPSLARKFHAQQEILPFKNSHLREIKVLSALEPAIADLSPRFLGSLEDDQREVFVLIQEFLEPEQLISEVEDLSAWTRARQQAVLKGIANLHAKYWNQKESALEKFPLALTPYEKLESRTSEQELWGEFLHEFLVKHSSNLQPELISFCREAMENYEGWMSHLGKSPSTLIHYDFNSRNIAFRGEQPVIFDWEFLAWGPALRDVIEFVIFTSSPETCVSTWHELLAFYRNELQAKGVDLGDTSDLMASSLKDFVIRRMPFYFILNELGTCPYFPRLLAVLQNLIQDLNAANS